MKRLTTFILCIIFPTIFFAQDMIVKSDGEKINCKIVDADSSLVSFQSEDSTKKEISVLQKQDVLAMQLHNEKTTFFFIPDTLYKSNGNKIVCKIIAIDPAAISYMKVDSTIGDLTMVANDKFSMIRFGNGSQEIIEKKSEYTNNNVSSNIDYYKMGEADAKKYYKTNATAAAEVFCGMGTWVLGVGFVAGAIVYAVPPKFLDNPQNPNNDLLKTNKDYYNGFLEGATRKKHEKAGLAYTYGVIAPVAIVVIGISIVLLDEPKPL